MIHYAQLENSPRLQRLLKVLSDGQPRTTWEIMQQARVAAVSTAIKELRMNGFEIICEQVKKGIYQYRLIGKEQGDSSPSAQNDTGDEDKSKAICESIMERNFQLSLKV